jgi:hypothetical protein
MRKLIRLFGFWYGCLGSLCALAWYISALLGSFGFPRNWEIVMAIAALHGVAACFTFQTHVSPAWEPLLSVTPGWIRLARTLFSLATLNFIVCFGIFLIAGKLGNQALEDKAVPLILTSFLLQNTVYVAIHWAFRPENLFPSAFIQAVANPLGSVLKLIFPGSPKKQ